VEVVGPASADLLVSSTAQDTDLQVTVTEVRPDGQEQWLQRGWLRLSHRKLDAELSTILRPYHTHRESDAAPLTPNTPVLARVEVMPFAHVFRAGSSIRLTVEAPTGVTLGHRFDYLKTPAVNTVHHDPVVGSRLVLGTIPGGRALKPLSACNTVNMEPCRANVIRVPAGRLSLE
jgi:predicted acyl esterase